MEYFQSSESFEIAASMTALTCVLCTLHTQGPLLKALILRLRPAAPAGPWVTSASQTQCAP